MRFNEKESSDSAALFSVCVLFVYLRFWFRSLRLLKYRGMRSLRLLRLLKWVNKKIVLLVSQLYSCLIVLLVGQ